MRQSFKKISSDQLEADSVKVGDHTFKSQKLEKGNHDIIFNHLRSCK